MTRTKTITNKFAHYYWYSMKRPTFATAFRPNYGVLVMILSIACFQVMGGNETVTTSEETTSDNRTGTESVSTYTTSTPYVSTTPPQCHDSNCVTCKQSLSSCEMCKPGYYLHEREVATPSPAVPTTRVQTTPTTVDNTSTNSTMTQPALYRTEEPLNTTTDSSPEKETMTTQAESYTCAQCMKHCKSCTNETHCVECVEYYAFDTNGSCSVEVPVTTEDTTVTKPWWKEYFIYLAAGVGGGVLLIILICVCICCKCRSGKIPKLKPLPDRKALGISTDKGDGVQKRSNTYQKSPREEEEEKEEEEEEAEEEEEEEEEVKPERRRPRSPAADPPASPPPNGNVVIDLPSPSHPPVDFKQMCVPAPPASQEPTQEQTASGTQSISTPLYGNIDIGSDLPDYENVPKVDSQPDVYVNVNESTSHLPTVSDEPGHEPTGATPRVNSVGSEDYYNAGPEQYYNVYPPK